jgi:hypothetical protein
MAESMKLNSLVRQSHKRMMGRSPRNWRRTRCEAVEEGGIKDTNDDDDEEEEEEEETMKEYEAELLEATEEWEKAEEEKAAEV